MTTFSIGLGNRETLAEALDRLDHELPLHKEKPLISCSTVLTSASYSELHKTHDGCICYLLGGYNLWREGCGDCDEARLTEVLNRAFDPEIREEVRARRKARKAGRRN